MKIPAGLATIDRVIRITGIVLALSLFLLKGKISETAMGYTAIAYLIFAVFMKFTNPFSSKRWAFLFFLSVLGLVVLICLAYIVFKFALWFERV